MPDILLKELRARVAELEEENTALVKTIQRDTLTSLRRLAASQAYAEQLREALNAWIEIASNCSIESGVCGCGEAMKNHSSPMACGHSPVDMADGAVNSAIEKTNKALSTPFTPTALPELIEKVEKMTIERCAQMFSDSGIGGGYLADQVRMISTGQIKLEELL